MQEILLQTCGLIHGHENHIVYNLETHYYGREEGFTEESIGLGLILCGVCHVSVVIAYCDY